MIERFMELVNTETELLASGRVSEAAALSEEKLKISRDLQQALTATDPKTRSEIQQRLQDLSPLLQKNAKLLGTAIDQSNQVIDRTAEGIFGKTKSNQYGASGKRQTDPTINRTGLTFQGGF